MGLKLKIIIAVILLGAGLVVLLWSIFRSPQPQVENIEPQLEVTVVESNGSPVAEISFQIHGDGQVRGEVESDYNLGVPTALYFDGGNSSDPDGDKLSYSWKLVEVPEGSTARFKPSKNFRNHFFADIEGTYAVSLTVSDGDLTNEKTVIFATQATTPKLVVTYNLTTDSPPAHEENGSEVSEDAELVSSGQEALGFDAALALQSFEENCSICHQSTGLGIPGTFPPLAEHVANLYNAEGGREYLILLPLYGLQGPIEVLGESFNAWMARRKMVSDEKIALALNHVVTSWGNLERLEDFSPYRPNDVASLRGQALTPGEVHLLRQNFELP
jgi:mono/diheme cytochrome c family protein